MQSEILYPGRALLTIPKSRLKRKRDQAFVIRAPRLSNCLPEEIRLADSLPLFKSLLKTHFFKDAFN
jgi:aminoglycoside phosphotransferase (APT) family kinase protein